MTDRKPPEGKSTPFPRPPKPGRKSAAEKAQERKDLRAMIREEKRERERERFESAVRKTARHLRVVDAARFRVAARNWKSPPDLGSAAAQLADGIPEVPEFVDELAKAKMKVLIVAQFKAGKTTLAMNLANAAVTGDPFLGKYPVHLSKGATVTYFNFELSQEQALLWITDMGISETPGAGDRLFLDHWAGCRMPLPSPHIEDYIVKLLLRRKSAMWIIDPFSAAYPGEENSNTEVSAWTDAIDRIMDRAGLKLVVLVSHTGESGAGEGGPRKARGATRLMDWMSVLWRYSHDGEGQDIPPSNNRYLRAFGRDVDVPEITLDYDSATRGLYVQGRALTRTENKTEQLARKVFEKVSGHFDKTRAPINTTELYKKFDTARTSSKAVDIRQAIDIAENKGWITITDGSRNAKLHQPGGKSP